MGDERRDFDTPGRTNGQQDQTEPVPPHDDTQPSAAPDETQPFRAPDQTASPEPQPEPAPDDTQPAAAPDDTQPFRQVPGRDETRVMPKEGGGGVWSGRAGVTPPAGPSLRDSAPYTQQIPQAEQPRPWWTPVLLGLLALGLLGVLILLAWWMGRDETPAPVEPSPTASAEATLEPTTQAPTAPASPTAAVAQIPRLVGLKVDDAAAKLDQLGLAYRFEYRQSDEPEGTVIQSSPPEGLVVPVQTTVTLVVSTGNERSPSPSPSPTRVVASATPGR